MSEPPHHDDEHTTADILAEEHRELGEEFFAALGRMAASWAGVEFAAHFNVHVIFKCYSGGTIEKEVPEQISRKMRYLKKAYRNIPEIAQHAESAEKLIKQTTLLSEQRHFALHGAYVEIISESSAKFVRRPSGFIDKTGPYDVFTVSKLKTLSTDMFLLSTDWNLLSFSLTDSFWR